jgi:hypothetical protein
MIDFKDKAASLVSLAKNRTKKQPVSEDQELRRLDRISLMELIVDQRKKIEELEAQLEEANSRLEARTVRLDIENVGEKEDLSRMLRSVLRELEGTFGTD